MTSSPSLGLGVDIDVPQLIKSRLLIQANSGGGKSYAIRRLCEQTFGLVQHIVIDREGEFYTLREKHDYALFGKGGDGPADLKSAPLLARRLHELRLSAIIDISELGDRQPQFVKVFLDALIDVPRALWHPIIVVLDEAHKFCPEKGRGESVSTGSVIDLMTVGRKRGLCGVLATQRVSKLHKDAAAECVSKIVGRCTLDVDRKRAAEELGLSDKDSVLALRDLEPGEFFAYGPSLAKGITKFKVGKVATTHPEAGEVAPPPVPPRTKVKKLLEELANLPREAEQEARTVAELQQENRKLKADLRDALKGARVETKEVKVPLVDKESLDAMIRSADQLDKHLAQLDRVRDRMAQAQQVVVSASDNLRAFAKQQLATLKPPGTDALPPRLHTDAIQMHMQQRPRIGAPPVIGAQRHPPMREAPRVVDDGQDLTPARQRILDTIALLRRVGVEVTRDSLAAWYGRHPRDKAFTNNLGALRTAGYLDDLQLTGQGQTAAQEIDIPSLAHLHQMLLDPLSPAQRRIMEILLESGELDRDLLAEKLNRHPRDKALTNNVGALRSRHLISRSWPARPSDVFYPQGL